MGCSASSRRAKATAEAQRALADAAIDLDIVAINITRAEDRMVGGGNDSE